MIVHRDLKPDNFLVFEEENGKEMRLKLSDFTSARQLNDGELTKSLWGTPIYMAPELLDHKKYTDKADLWSVGVIMYRLLYNSLPYTGQSWAELANNIKTLPLTFPVNVDIGDDARDLLMRLLRRDPYERISWEEFFTHSFFTNPIRRPNSAPDSPKSVEALRQEMQEQLNKYKDAFNSSQQQIKLLEQQLKEGHERETRMEELISQMRDKDQSEDTDSMRRKLLELEKERAIWMSSAESRLGTDKSTEALVNSLKSEIERLKKSNAKGNKTNFQELELGFREQIEVLNRRIKELEIENSGHSEQYNTIMNLFKKDVEDIEQSNSKLMKEKNALEEELKRHKLFEAENKSLQQICRQLKEKEEEKDRQLLGMAEEVEKLRRDNATYEKQYIEILSESLKSEENSKLNDETISLLREKLRETELILAECQKDREQLTQELSRFRTVSSGEFGRSGKENGKEDRKERTRGNSGKS
jgi:serine/threonine protein kinase